MTIPRIGPNNGVVMRWAAEGPLIELLASLLGNDSMVPGLTIQQALNNLLATSGVSAWDVIVEDLSDLPSPVAGFIDLTSGSYAFKNPINIGGDVLRVPAGTSVLLKGMGGLNQKVVTGSGAEVLRVEGNARIETLNLSGTGADALAVTGEVDAVQCEYQTTGAGRGVVVESGIYQDTQGQIAAAGSALLMQDGFVTLSQTVLLSTGGNALELQGGTQLLLQHCLLESVAAAAMLINAGSTDVTVTGSEIVCLLANGDCIHVTLGSTLQFVGGLWRTNPGARGNGLHLDGNVDGGLQVIGVSGEDISTGDGSGEAFVLYTSGTTRRATIQGCNTATSVLTAINWPAANIPTNGLLVVGNEWDDPTPYVGFAPTDARVNCKANSFQSGLMTETAIVP